MRESVNQVSDVVVCGHSQCGAMAALLGGVAQATALPHLAEWLEIARPVRELLARDYQHLNEPVARAIAAAAENVLFALENLRSYPCVQQRLARGGLHLHGWFFKIASAELFAYDPETHQFAPLIRDEPRESP